MIAWKRQNHQRVDLRLEYHEMSDASQLKERRKEKVATPRDETRHNMERELAHLREHAKHVERVQLPF